MLKVSRAGDYAIRGMVYLAQEGRDRPVLSKTVAEHMDVPHAFLAKVLQWLAKTGILESFQGHQGGFQLTRDPARVTVLEVVEAVEGSIRLHTCVEKRPTDAAEDYVVGRMMKRAQDNLTSAFQGVTIEDLRIDIEAHS